jgi:hypothetical protein
MMPKPLSEQEMLNLLDWNMSDDDLEDSNDEDDLGIPSIISLYFKFCT